VVDITSTYPITDNRVDVSSPGDSMSTSQGSTDLCPKTLFVADSASNPVSVTHDGTFFELPSPGTY
jgi:hypothetical protein